MNDWIENWADESYISLKEENFLNIENFLQCSPKKILDIGCGLAFESERFQKKYNSKIWLLDSDFSNTEDNVRDVSFGPVETFKFYSRIDDLTNSFDQRNMKYVFVDANNINIDDDVTFDLIYSFVSCGFHYPASTYKSLIQKHKNKKTKVILDIRKKSICTDIKIINVIAETKKYITAQIEFT